MCVTASVTYDVLPIVYLLALLLSTTHYTRCELLTAGVSSV